jgi:hypothetical protein
MLLISYAEAIYCVIKYELIVVMLVVAKRSIIDYFNGDVITLKFDPCK